ncbi:MAG: hypothetical protein O3C67_03365 [Cyanobacteria bacterium]|nr:hypothetical protein [Cyanobacteriota bacterium]
MTNDPLGLRVCVLPSVVSLPEVGSDIRLPDTFSGCRPLRPYELSGVERHGSTSID